MSCERLVRRPELEPRSDADADLSAGWRQFVLDQVGYDEVARERTARRADRRRALRRFLGGMAFGLIVFALALAVTIAAQYWHEGRFDRYLPKKVEKSMPPPPSARWVRSSPAGVPGTRDTHTELQNPFAPPPRAPSSDGDDDGSDDDGI